MREREREVSHEAQTASAVRSRIDRDGCISAARRRDTPAGSHHQDRRDLPHDRSIRDRDITAAGGVFGAETTGTLASVAFKPVGWAVKFPPRDHVFVYTATDEYTFGGGTFTINFEASCNLVSIDFETGDVVAACSGNWQVNGGTGTYSRVKGTGTFTETQELDFTGAGTGSITLVGKMHDD